jgi:hypothetical protein
MIEIKEIDPISWSDPTLKHITEVGNQLGIIRSFRPLFRGNGTVEIQS